MKNINIEKIKKGYVSDECVQVMESYTGSYMTIIGDKLLFYKEEKDGDSYNRYITDGRRFSFPYSSIPEHVESCFFGKLNYVNELYDFGKKYVVLKDGLVFGESVFKGDKKGEGIVVRENLTPEFPGDDGFDFTYKELCDYMTERIPDNAYVYSNYGRSITKDESLRAITGFDDASIIYVTTSLEGASASGMKIYRNGHKFDVILFDFIPKDLTNEDAIELSSDAPYAHEPKIKRRLNPSVQRDTILRAKSMSNILNN